MSQQSEVRFQLLVESIQDYAIFMLDPKGHVVSWNAGAQRFKGYRAEEIVGRHFGCFYPVETQKSGWPDYELRIASAEGRFEDEGWRVRKDGSLFWAHVTITALFESDGTLAGFAKVTRDLTQTRKVEALEESERRMTEFLAMLSHELRNPLAPIRSMIDVFKTKDVQDPQLKVIRDVIDNQVTHLTRIVSDLLDVSRIKHGLVSVRSSPLALADVVSHSVQAVRPLVELRKHDLQVENADETMQVEGDLVRLTQVFVNLLNNAATYTEPGGEILLRLTREGREAVITVRDNGRGIEEENLPVIFEFFRRPQMPIEEGHSGLGIGLSLVKRLVELHDGSIEGRSKGLGWGSEFVIRLPLLDYSLPDREDPGVDQAKPATLRKVLVVDDNKDFAESLAMLLESLGHETHMAHDGQAALEAAETYDPDVVLLDIGLPKLDGYEVARRLRAKHGSRYVLAALTGWGQDEDREKARSAGFDHHLVKPVEIDMLEHVLLADARQAS